MNLFNIGRGFAREQENQNRAADLREEAASFNLAGDGGYMAALKLVLFALFGYYNARLFIVTVPGWEGYLTAFCALAGEVTALYCLFNFTRSAGAHKAALGIFGGAFTLFSLTHATISFFRMEQQADLSGPIKFYSEKVAFPVLFSLLLLAAIAIPLCHWRKKIAAEQARAQVKIATSRARLVAESANLQHQAQLENERLNNLEERIQIEGRYLEKLEQFARLKEREGQAIGRISDPALRAQIRMMLNRPDVEEEIETPHSPAPSQPKTRAVWFGGRRIDDEQSH